MHSYRPSIQKLLPCMCVFPRRPPRATAAANPLFITRAPHRKTRRLTEVELTWRHLHMSKRHSIARSIGRIVSTLAMIGLAASGPAACGNDTAPPVTVTSPLAGLISTTDKDSSGASVPANGTAGTGTVNGSVMGPSNGGTGDTLATAPRVAGVRIAAFKVTGGTTANPTLAAEVAAATTGTDGKFTAPVLDGGDYVFTITPPSSRSYVGVWASTPITANSINWPWWVVLPKK